MKYLAFEKRAKKAALKKETNHKKRAELYALTEVDKLVIECGLLVGMQ